MLGLNAKRQHHEDQYVRICSDAVDFVRKTCGVRPRDNKPNQRQKPWVVGEERGEYLSLDKTIPVSGDITRKLDDLAWRCAWVFEFPEPHHRHPGCFHQLHFSECFPQKRFNFLQGVHLRFLGVALPPLLPQYTQV